MQQRADFFVHQTDQDRNEAALKKVKRDKDPENQAAHIVNKGITSCLGEANDGLEGNCLLYTSPSPRDS